MRSGFVGIAATHRSSAGRALAALASSRPRDAGAADGRPERPERPARGGTRRPGIAATRAGETMMRAVAVFVGREV